MVKVFQVPCEDAGLSYSEGDVSDKGNDVQMTATMMVVQSKLVDGIIPGDNKRHCSRISRSSSLSWLSGIPGLPDMIV